MFSYHHIPVIDLLFILSWTFTSPRSPKFYHRNSVIYYIEYLKREEKLIFAQSIGLANRKQLVKRAGPRVLANKMALKA